MKMNRICFGIALIAALGLAACSSGGEAPTAETTAAPAEMAPVVLTTADAGENGGEAETAKAESTAAEPETSPAETEESTEAEETAREETTAAATAVATGAGMDGLVQAEHAGVYRLQYDPALFELVESEGTDSYKYIVDGEFPVYVAVQPLPEVTPENLTAALILQSGRDDIQAADTELGLNAVPVKSIYIEEEANGETRIQLFHVVPWGAGSILVETGSYTGAGEVVDSGIETMLGTFEVIG